jgi:hypothetical protein
MALVTLKDNPSVRELRQFALIWFPLFWVAVAAILFYYEVADATTAVIIVGCGFLIGGAGAIRVAFIRPIFLGWMYAAYPIGWLVSHVLLGTIYYLMMTPLALMMRLLGHDPLRRRFERSASTYWEATEAVRDKTQYFRQL